MPNDILIALSDISQRWLTVALVVVTVLAAAAIISRWMTRRRHRAWRRFAPRHGLSFQLVDGRPQVTGRVDGRDVRLAIDPESSDTGELGVEVVTLSVSLHDRPPEGFQVARVARMAEVLHEKLDADDVETADEPFDRRATVTCPDRRAAVRYCNDRRRRGLLELFENIEAEECGIENGRLYARGREFSSDSRRPTKWLEHLLRAADTIDDQRASSNSEK